MKQAAILKGFATSTRWGILIVNGQGTVEYVNPAASGIFGYEQDELVGQPITIIIPTRLRGAHTDGMTRVVGGGRSRHGGKTVEVSALRKDGNEVPIEMTLSVWQEDAGTIAGAMIKDISERRARDARLLRLATHDPLTGLLNKSAFKEGLAEAMTRGPASVLLVSLDKFREVNDLVGRVMADSLIQAVGVRLTYHFGDELSVGRLDADEFGIFVRRSLGPAEAESLAAELSSAFIKPFSLGGMEFHLFASIGIAISCSDISDAEELLAVADCALQKVKSRGGRGYSIFDDGMRQESEASRTLRDELRRAVKQNELKLFYQPQFELLSKRLVGFEALLRWEHPDRGLLTPAAFLPALDHSLLTLEIGWWALDEACRMAAGLNRHWPVKMGVNLFPMQFRAIDICERVKEALERHQLSPHSLELELTEEIALDDIGAAIDSLKALKNIGVGLAFDDFGTGYASLSSLQKLHLSTLKIDRTFVQHVHEVPSDAAIVKAVLSMSSELGLTTIAEGIETIEQEAKLIEFGCKIGQGYLYGKPACEATTIGRVEALTAGEKRGANPSQYSRKILK